MALHLHSPLLGLVDAGDDPEQGGLAGAVVADDGETVAVGELQVEEVSERYRGSVSVGTELASNENWTAFIKIGKAVLYPIDQLEAWDRKNSVACRTSKHLSVDSGEEA